ncbi:MAG: hypothetical protein SPI19_01135 [Peptoniphilaceae bacterium]|nr:hypothetical protein [Peptoniphilaceae bacterium]
MRQKRIELDRHKHSARNAAFSPPLALAFPGTAQAAEGTEAKATLDTMIAREDAMRDAVTNCTL